MSWSPPPRPCDVVPAWKAGKTLSQLRADVLFDFRHDADLKSAVLYGPHSTQSPDGTCPMVAGAAAPTGQDVAQAILWPRGFVGLHPDQGFGTQATLEAFAKKIMPAVDNAVRRRSALGPLPPNDYGDPVVVYYYDTDRIKRVSYPRNTITTSPGMALDPGQRQWWTVPGAHVEQKNDDGTWGDEGWDWNRDVAGELTAIGSAILAVLGAVLVATGVGAAAGAAILAWSAALIAWGEGLAAALSGADPTFAIQNMIGALAQFVGGQIPPGALAALGKAAVTGAKNALESLLPIAQKTAGLSFSDAVAAAAAELSQGAPVTDQTEQVLVALVGPSAGKVIDAGYGAADYAEPEQIDGILGLLEQDDAKTLFRLGALLGWMRKHQTRSARGLPTSPTKGAAAPPRPSAAVLAVHADAKAALEAYVRGTLFPRYGLK